LAPDTPGGHKDTSYPNNLLDLLRSLLAIFAFKFTPKIPAAKSNKKPELTPLTGKRTR
jgi:hypothetical protein